MTALEILLGALEKHPKGKKRGMNQKEYTIVFTEAALAAMDVYKEQELKKNISFNLPVIGSVCPRCKGSGMPQTITDNGKCKRCNGTGQTDR